MPTKTICQDDCAPDSMEQFEKEVKEYFGEPFQKIKEEMILAGDLGDTLIYVWNDCTVINEIGIYKIEIEV